MIGMAGEALRFLRVAAAELREIAEHAPDIAAELRRIADELEAQATANLQPAHLG